MKLLFTFVLLLPAVFTGCSSGKPERSLEAINEIVTSKATEKKLAAAGPAVMGPLKEKSRSTAPDGSEIIVSADAAGNQVSIRNTSNNPRVSSINVQEFADGRVVVSVIGKDGSRVEVSPHLKNAAFLSNPDDFANLAGFADVPATTPSDQNLPASSMPAETETAANPPGSELVSATPSTSPAEAKPVPTEIKSAASPAGSAKGKQVELEKLRQLQRDLSGLISKVSDR